MVIPAMISAPSHRHKYLLAEAMILSSICGELHDPYPLVLVAFRARFAPPATTPGSLQNLPGHKSPISCLSFDNKESSLIAGASDGAVKVFSLSSMQEGRHLRGSSGSIRCAAWHPLNAALIGTAGAATAVKMWDLRTKNNFMTYSQHDGGVDVLTFSPDGRWLFVGDSAGSVTWWDLTAGKQLAKWQCFTEPCSSIAFHPTDFFVVAAAADGQCSVFSLDSKASIAVGSLQATPAHPGAQAAFLHSGTHVALAGGDEAVLYDFDPLAPTSEGVLTLAAHLDGSPLHGALDMWCGRRRHGGTGTSDISKRHAAVVAGRQGSNVVVTYLDLHTLGGFPAPPPAAVAAPPSVAAGAGAHAGSAAESKRDSATQGGIAMRRPAQHTRTPQASPAHEQSGEGKQDDGTPPAGKNQPPPENESKHVEDDDSSVASVSSDEGHTAAQGAMDSEGGVDSDDEQEQGGSDDEEVPSDDDSDADGTPSAVALLQYKGPALPNHPALAARIASFMAAPPAARPRPAALLGDAVLHLKSEQFMPQAAAPASNLGATAVVASLGSRVGPSAVGKLKGRERAREALRSGHGRPPSAASTPRRIPRAGSAASTPDSDGGSEGGGSEAHTPLGSATPLGHAEHSALAKALRQRLDRVCDLRDMWRRGEMDAFVSQLVALQDHAVACDVLGEARLGGAGLALHHVTELGPLLGAMLQRTYSGYVSTALACLSAFVRSFAPVIAGAVSTASSASIGVDVAAEARAARCIAAWDALHDVYDGVAAHLRSDDSGTTRTAAEVHAMMARQLFTPALLDARAKLP